MLLRDMFLEQDNDWSSLFDPARKGYPKSPAAETSHDQHEQPSTPSSPQGLAAEQGAVFDYGEDKLAVYRDGDGRLHAVTGECTHLGCPLRFNAAERSWDCHCHGSRFGIDGRVLQGPAVADLAAQVAPNVDESAG